MLEREGFAERVDHRSLKAQALELEPEGYNPHIADRAEQTGDRAREKLRCEGCARGTGLIFGCTRIIFLRLYRPSVRCSGRPMFVRRLESGLIWIWQRLAGVGSADTGGDVLA